MNQKFHLTKNAKIILMLGFFTVVITALLYLAATKYKPGTVLPNQWQGIRPDQSSSYEVKEVLGDPISPLGPTRPHSNYYSSDSQYYPHEVMYTDNRAALLIQRSLQFPEGGALTYYQSYGDPQAILNTNLTGIGMHLYVWNNVGIALLVHDQSGKIFEIWRFSPTNIDDFNSKFKDYIGEYDPNHF